MLGVIDRLGVRDWVRDFVAVCVRVGVLVPVGVAAWETDAACAAQGSRKKAASRTPTKRLRRIANRRASQALNYAQTPPLSSGNCMGKKDPGSLRLGWVDGVRFVCDLCRCAIVRSAKTRLPLLYVDLKSILETAIKRIPAQCGRKSCRNLRIKCSCFTYEVSEAEASWLARAQSPSSGHRESLRTSQIESTLHLFASRRNMDLIAYVPRMPAVGETITGSAFQTGFGGKGANQCVIAAKLGAAVAMCGAVGDDSFGRDMVANFERLGTDVSRLRVRSGAGCPLSAAS